MTADPPPGVPIHPASPPPPLIPELVPDPSARFAEPPRDRVWLHVLLFAFTILTTTQAGTGFFLNHISHFGARPIRASASEIIIGGLWFALTALSILTAHEMGHYVACRIYRINASLPYFLPMPAFSYFGTMGAVIRIRDPIRSKRMLFDIGVAGPIAGFMVAVPALVIGLLWSRVDRLPRNFRGDEFGEPWGFQLLAQAIFGPVPEGYSLNLHPMAWAAWFGFLITALNLLPLGQLDGGHIAYAVWGRRAKWLTYGTLAGALVLGVFVSYSWVFWLLIMLLLLYLSGWSHPHTTDEHEPLDRLRLLIAALALLIFILCFTPRPISPAEFVR